MLPVFAQDAPKAAGIPRLADGKPDLQGIWEARNTADGNLEAHSAAAGIRAGEGVIVDPPDGKIPYQPWAAAKQKENFAKRASTDPVNKCFLPGLPRITYMHYPFQIFQTPKFVAITYEYVHASRTVHMDRSPHLDDIEFWMGDSRGHWEGDTLVVDTVALNDKSFIDNSSPHSEDMTVHERFRFISPGVLEDRITVNDPKALTKPWETVHTYRKAAQPNDELREFACAEGLGHSPK